MSAADPPRPEPQRIQRAQIASATSGRIRVRFARGPNTSADLAILQQTLEPMAEIRAIRVRPAAASAILEFDPSDATTVEGQLRELGLRGSQNDRRSSLGEPAVIMKATASVINRAVGQRLPGDLRLLVPLALGLLSLRQFARGDDRLSEAPWYLLAWYASESFSKLQPASPSAAPTVDEV